MMEKTITKIQKYIYLFLRKTKINKIKIENYFLLRNKTNNNNNNNNNNNESLDQFFFHIL